MAQTPGSKSMHAAVGEYYTRKLTENGPTPKGVDWNGESSQVLRFEQLCTILDEAGEFSLVDFGCGYGALVDFLIDRYRAFDYIGIDLSPAMIEAARQRNMGRSHTSFAIGSRPPQADYVVSSGIFNVKLDRPVEEWQSYVHETLDEMNGAARRGFAFNCLTSYSDPDRMRADLYYADPLQMFDRCMRRYSRNVAILHDYGLYEFTIIVRKA
jgi:SAM-dependent methyltransferase